MVKKRMAGDHLATACALIDLNTVLIETCRVEVQFQREQLPGHYALDREIS